MRICLRFRPEKDEDLIDWYQSLPEGERSRIIRTMLRELLSDNHPGTKRNFLQNGITSPGGDLRNVKIEVQQEDKQILEEDVDRKLDGLLDSF